MYYNSYSVVIALYNFLVIDSNLSSSGRAKLGHSLSMKSRKRWARDVTDTCATHVGLLHDVKNTHCKTQIQTY